MISMLTTRPYQGESDLQAIATFLNACEAIDQEGQYYSISELKIEFTEPGVDPERDLRLWLDAAGALVAFGQLWIPPHSTYTTDGWLWFRVHPDARGQGLERDIVAWGESQLRQVAQERQLPAMLRSGCRETQTEQRELLEFCGYEYERCFLTMGRSLIPPIPQPQLPDGFRLGYIGKDATVEDWVDAYNQSFVDHWQFHPTTVAEHQHWLTDPYYRPELDLVALTPNGTVAAFCHCSINPEANTHKNCNEGWVNILGTRRGFRRLGLARAVLLAGLNQLWQAGVDTAKLGVDTQNPNSAKTLYESAGFRRLYARSTFVKALT